MKKLIFDEKQFYITGNIPCVSLNMSENQCINVLPRPEDISEFSKYGCIWRYGNSLELHFNGDDKNSRKLFLIFSDNFEQIENTEDFKFIPWLIHKDISKQSITDISLPYVLQRLNAENIPIIIKYSKMMDMVELHLTKSGVVLLFENVNSNYIDKVVSNIQEIYKNDSYKFITFSRSLENFSEYHDYKVIDVRL